MMKICPQYEPLHTWRHTSSKQLSPRRIIPPFFRCSHFPCDRARPTSRALVHLSFFVSKLKFYVIVYKMIGNPTALTCFGLHTRIHIHIPYIFCIYILFQFHTQIVIYLHSYLFLYKFPL